MKERNNQLLVHARALRKSMTKEEKHLWYDFLRSHPVRFRRQEIIGNYIADFYCAIAKLVVELDGSQHYDPEEVGHDMQRTSYLQGLGIKVIRFSNLDIWSNLEGVCLSINQEIANFINTPESLP